MSGVRDTTGVPTAGEKVNGGPPTDAEALVRSIWSEALTYSEAADDDDFFFCGGDSSRAAGVVARLGASLNVPLTLAAFFEEPTIAGLIRRVELLLREDGRHAAEPSSMPRRNASEARASLAQERFFFADQAAADNAVFNVSWPVRLRGPLDRESLHQALTQVVERHEVLRTRFVVADGQPTQVVEPPLDLPLAYSDLSADPDPVEAARRLVDEQVHLPLDVGRAPLIRAQLLRLGDGDHVFQLVVHHIAFDDWSMGILFDELGELYAAALAGTEPTLAEPAVQYADYAEWQRDRLTDEVLERELAHWQEQLADVPVVDLPTDRPRPAVPALRGERIRLPLRVELVEAVVALARAEGATPFMAFLAAFDALLHRYTGQDEIVVGTAVDNRGHADLERAVGLFTNPIVLRTDLAGDPSLRELIARVRARTIDGVLHQELPFSRLAAALPERDASRHPVFQVFFEFIRPGPRRFELRGFDLELFEAPKRTAEFDLGLYLDERTGGTDAVWEYSTDLFDQATVERMGRHFELLLEALVTDPDRSIGTVPLVSADERRRALADWNSTSVELQSTRIEDAFSERARAVPELAAVQDGTRLLTYAELNERANRLGHLLRGRGVNAGDSVGLCMNRSADLIIALLGILKSGGAYVPLNPEHPPARLAQQLADAGARVLVTETACAPQLPAYEGDVVSVDADSAELAEQPSEDPEPVGTPDDPVYVLYTSGSTGTPKGVVVRHRNLWNYTSHMLGKLGGSEGIEGLQFGVVSAISTDLGNTTVFPSLIGGGCLHVVDEETAKDGALFAEYVREHPLDVLKITPSHLRSFFDAAGVDEVLPSRWLVTGGEAATWDLFERAASTPGLRVLNHYGPTETTVGSCTYDFEPGEPHPAAASVPIGRPISNTRAYVLDANREPVPVGVRGELYLAGAGVAAGYAGSPEQTDEVFVHDPFAEDVDARMYRTGDLARYLDDGNIEFLGRRDEQVKIRGYRVEPAEVEAALGSHPALKRAAVVAQGEADDRRLVAYVVPGPEGVASGELRAFLEEKLPAYMVPAAFVTLDALPLTPNGKLDRRALPDPDEQAGVPADVAKPSNATEAAIAYVWEELLGREVGVDADFFESGGHSILAVRLIARLRSEFEVQLTLRDLIADPTIAGLAAKVRASKTDEAAADDLPPLVRVPRDRPLHCSFAQEQFWLVDQLVPGSAAYNFSWPFALNGPLAVEVLERALTELVRRHESLRTRFGVEDGEPVQIVDPPADRFQLICHDLRDHPESSTEAQRLIDAQTRTPFDLERGPLLRVQLLELDDDEHILQVVVHHIVFDGVAKLVFFRELSELYEAFAKGMQSPLTDPPVQYGDYAEWQRSWLQGDVIDGLLAHWREQLEGVPEALDLPVDRPRPPVTSQKGARLSKTLEPELKIALEALAQGEGATFFMTMLAAFDVLLHRYTGLEDIVVGTPVDNRARPEIEEAIGVFINTVVIRSDLSGSPSFRQLLARVRERTLEAVAHQELPFERLVQALHPDRDVSRHPIFQVLLAVNPAEPEAPLQIRDVSIEPVETEWPTARVDLFLLVEEQPHGLDVIWEYSTDLFDKATIERLAGHFTRLLEQIVTDPDQPVSHVALLGDDEARHLLVELNDTSTAIPSGCLHDLIAQQCAASPERVAVDFDGSVVTYGELDSRSSRLANHLVALGVEPEELVAICVERSADMLVGLLGILKAGAAYVPIDPTYPAERQRFMLEDAQVRVVVTQEALLPALPQNDAQLVCLDRDWPQIERLSSEAPGVEQTPENLAYVIYTSGSTGIPKGVEISHRALVNFLATMRERPGLARDDVLVAVTTLSFDIAGLELYLPLISGARLVVASRDTAADPVALQALLERTHATVMQATPTTWQMLIDSSWPGNPQLKALCGGEALPGALADQLVGRVGELWNMYGPTETTIWSSIDKVIRGEALSIGRPIGNTSLYILDERLQPVPVGVPGELYIGGAGLARGYRGRPDLTTERFLPDQFDSSVGARMYKTGDLARYRPDGKVEYLGRLDQQVKVRGFRIELGEIETQLARHPDVAAAVVATEAPRPGENRLVGYVIPEGEPVSTGVLRAFLEETLPAYMIPSAFVTLDCFPLTPNGKVDRKALPASSGHPDAVGREHVEPRTEAEQEIARLWRDLLELDRIGIDDNFFEIGGHSLLAARLLSRLRAKLDVELPLRALFEGPTIRALARRVEEGAEASGPKPPPLVPLARVRRCSFAQERFWFLDKVTENNAVYNVSLPLRLRGLLDLNALGRALNEIVRRHESLRTRFAVEDGKPTQIVEPAADVNVPVIDLSAASEADREEAARKLIDEQTQMPLDLAAGPLLRAQLLRLREDEHVLQLVFHHIAFDGWSKTVLFRELAALYGAFTESKAPPLPELAVQYGDYADWQRSWLTDDVLEPHLAYWKSELEGMPGAIELPTERTRPPLPSLVGAWHRTTLSAELIDALRRLSRDNGATLFTTLLAAFDVLLYRYTGQDDLVVGTPVDTRDRPELEDLIGVFINTLPVRSDLSGAPSFRELLGRVHDRTLEAVSHQLLPFERLVQELQGERDHSRHPIFQVLLAINPPESPLDLPGLAVEEVESEKTGARLDLSLMLQEHPDRLDAVWEYSTDVFSAESMSRLSRSFTRLLEEIVSDPDRPITTLDVIDDLDRRRVLHTWNETQMEYRSDACLHDLVAEVAGERAGSVAVVDASGELRYGELEARSNQLAHRLRGMGVGRGALVGISLTRSRELLVGLLGILKAGAAYVPVDPTYPAERQAFMLEHSEVAVVVTEREVAAKLPAGTRELVLVDVDAALIAQEPSAPPAVEMSPEDLAYVIYTSGSTGTPKGVEVSHRALVNFLTTMQRRPGLGEEDVLLAVTTLSFDIAGLELYLPLVTGARVIIASNETSADPRRLMELMEKHQVSVMQATPTTWRMLIDAGWSGRKDLKVLCGGEALPLSLADQLVERGVELWNMYGPTETTIWSTVVPISSQGEPLTIGRPIGNTTLYILDPLLQPVPVGVVGELHIGGDGLARGYRKQPDLTAERFIPDPFGVAGERLYKTGDLARYRQDGDVEYVGRIDHQVKLRGFRIELGEIETVLSRHVGVTAAVAAVKEDERGDRRLAAYVVPDQEKAGVLRSFLRLQREGRLSEATCHELPNGMLVAHANLTETEYLFEDIFVRQAYLQHGIVVPDGACVFDVGANIGIFSLLVAETAQRIRIFAFEPIPPVFELLQLNAELHGLNATLLDCGVGADAGMAEFTYFPNNSILSGRFAKPEDEILAVRQMLAAAGDGSGAEARLLEERLRERMASEVVTRPIQTLSKVIADHGVERIDLLKIDAEKSEQDVFAGLSDEDWPKVEQVVVEVHGQEVELERIVSMLEARGFTVDVGAENPAAGEGQYTVYGRRAALKPGTHRDDSEWRSPSRLRADLLSHLKAQLPEYMIPGSLTLLEELPLTPNGKLDRTALPEPARAQVADEYIAPSTPLQQSIVDVWKSVLPGDRVGLRTDFFALGGHSLLGAQVIMRLSEQLGLDLPLRAIFEHPTVGELAAHIDALRASASNLLSPDRHEAPSPRREHAQRSPLSFSQHQLWFLEQWKPGAPTYNLTSALRLRGDLDDAALEGAFRSLVERHEALRTSFVVEAGEPVQYVRDSWNFQLARIDLRERGAKRDEECLRRVNELMQLPFDLASDLMLRVTLMKLDAAEHVLVVQSHHIACDGWSEALLLDELNELYEAQRSGRDAGLPELAFQYADFASWQREHLSAEVLDEHLSYWRRELAGAPTTIDLADHPRPAVQTFVGRNLFLSMPRDVAEGVRELARRERVTPFMLLLAALATVLYRLSGQDDILIGGPVANRARREFERVVGFVSNTIVLRARLGGNPTFSELLARMRETTVGALAHEETPFEKVVEALAPRRDPGVNPLFQVNFRAFPEPTPPELSGLEIDRLQLDSGGTRFDLALELHLREDGIGGFFKYNTDLFESSTIERVAADFEQLLVDAIRQPDTRLLGFALASDLRPLEQAARTDGKGIRGSRERRRPDSGGPPAADPASLSGRLVIREAAADDLETILDLQEAASLETQREIFEPVGYPAEAIRARWRASFGSGKTRFMVAEVDSAIVGVSISAPPWLFAIHVARPFWGTEVARVLGVEMMDYVEAAGFDEAFGWVLAENHRSRRFMERMGWRPDGASRQFREPPHPLMLRYSCDLKRRKTSEGPDQTARWGRQSSHNVS